MNKSTTTTHYRRKRTLRTRLNAYADIYNLRTFHGMGAQQIADKYGITVNQVNGALQSHRKMINS